MNVRDSLEESQYPDVHSWLDSGQHCRASLVNGDGEYRQFVANRVQNIKQQRGIVWRHVATDQTQADLGSREGGECEKCSIVDERTMLTLSTPVTPQH